MKRKQKKTVKMGKNNEAPAWAMGYGACATHGHDYQNRIQDHGHVCSRWKDPAHILFFE